MAEPVAQVLAEDLLNHLCVRLPQLDPSTFLAYVSTVVEVGKADTIVTDCGGTPLRVEFIGGYIPMGHSQRIFNHLVGVLASMGYSLYPHPMYSPGSILYAASRDQVYVDPRTEPFVFIERGVVGIGAPVNGALRVVFLVESIAGGNGGKPLNLSAIFDAICRMKKPKNPYVDKYADTTAYAPSCPTQRIVVSRSATTIRSIDPSVMYMHLVNFVSSAAFVNGLRVIRGEDLIAVQLVESNFVDPAYSSVIVAKLNSTMIVTYPYNGAAYLLRIDVVKGEQEQPPPRQARHAQHRAARRAPPPTY